MKRELKALREQKAELMDGLGKRSPSPKTNGFIKENEKLQVIKIIQRILRGVHDLCVILHIKKQLMSIYDLIE